MFLFKMKEDTRELKLAYKNYENSCLHTLLTEFFFNLKFIFYCASNKAVHVN